MEDEEIEKRIIKLRLQFIHRPIKKRFLGKKFPFLIQNEPFEYGVRIKNIGEEPFSGATLDDFVIEANNSGIHQRASKSVKIKPLNPGEEYDLFIDRYTLWHEGSIGTRCNLIPESETEEIQAYQHHRDHDIDEPYRKKNCWWHDYYCQSQQQLLQTRTNHLILLLTIITVLEAVFGLNNILKFSSSILALVFHELFSLFSWLAS